MGRTRQPDGETQRPKPATAGGGGNADAPGRRKRLKLASIFALLEEAGYRRHEIGKLDWDYAIQVINHPRTEDGRIKPQYETVSEDSDVDDIRTLLVRRGWPEWRIRDHMRAFLVGYGR